MKLIGELRKITARRDDKNQAIEIHIDKVEYLTHKKDGRYFQAFDFEDSFETPLIITGDCLAQSSVSEPENGEFDFTVYDKVGDEYIANKNKTLEVTTFFDEEENLTILSEIYYSETLPPAEFEKLKLEREKTRKFIGRKKR